MTFTVTFEIPSDQELVMSALWYYIKDAENRQSSAMKRQREEAPHDGYLAQGFEHAAERYGAIVHRMYQLREEIRKNEYIDFRTEAQIVEALRQVQKELET